MKFYIFVFWISCILGATIASSYTLEKALSQLDALIDNQFGNNRAKRSHLSKEDCFEDLKSFMDSLSDKVTKKVELCNYKVDESASFEKIRLENAEKTEAVHKKFSICTSKTNVKEYNDCMRSAASENNEILEGIPLPENEDYAIAQRDDRSCIISVFTEIIAESEAKYDGLKECLSKEIKTSEGTKAENDTGNEIKINMF